MLLGTADWLGLTAADWAQVGSALFAAVAAGASWATVAQARRERKRRETPDIHMRVIQRLPSNEVDIHVVNYGGPAKDVRFCVVESGQVAYGTLPPNGHIDPGEHRTLTTALVAADEKAPAIGYVAGFNLLGDRMFVSSLNGDERRWRFRRRFLPDRKTSDHDVLKAFYPDIGDITALPWVIYEVKGD
jgi:hypothetical protein